MPLAENDTLSTLSDKGKRVWLYPIWLRGRFLSWRRWVHLVLVVLILIGPWIDIGGFPAVRIDIPGRRIYFWGSQFLAHDGAYILFALGVFFFAVFLFTALFGRAWCGWACPQTVFMESILRPIERLIEGPPSRRKKLDKAPWGLTKIFKKGLKYFAFLLVCGAMGTTFVAYFLGSEGIYQAQLDPFSHPAGSITFLVITGLCFFDFAWFREQTCVVVCPYGRFQSVLLDADSLSVNYDEKRGEPRGKVRKKCLPIAGQEPEPEPEPKQGDCVDCKKCVSVCPTGIDIRKGVQMECIQCMACIDACDDMMDRLKRPRGLVRFASENKIEGKITRILRPRVIVYAVCLVAILIASSISLASRQDVGMHVGRQVGAPFVVTPDNRVQNSLQVRISNRGRSEKFFEARLSETDTGELVTPVSPFVVPAGDLKHFPVFVIRPNIAASASPVKLQIVEVTDAGKDAPAGELTIDFLVPTDTKK